MGECLGRNYPPLSPAKRKAAAEALLDLGLMYSTGALGEPDYVTAHTWFNLAAISGNRTAQEHRLEVARDMSTAEISRAQRMARNWVSAR